MPKDLWLLVAYEPVTVFVQRRRCGIVDLKLVAWLDINLYEFWSVEAYFACQNSILPKFYIPRRTTLSVPEVQIRIGTEGRLGRWPYIFLTTFMKIEQNWCLGSKVRGPKVRGSKALGLIILEPEQDDTRSLPEKELIREKISLKVWWFTKPPSIPPPLTRF